MTHTVAVRMPHAYAPAVVTRVLGMPALPGTDEFPVHI
jgi:hypothetical protein